MAFYSLHLGLNEVDPGHYQGWAGKLTACEADARSLQQLVLSLATGSAISPAIEYETDILLTQQVTRAAVLDRLRHYATTCKAGDLFLLTYSGHGGQLPDLNGDEPDGLDETWVLYDAQLVDDELYLAYSQFAEGVRLFILSDSCHSGSVLKAAYYAEGGHVAAKTYRNMPNAVAQQTFNANRPFYEQLLQSLTDKTGLGREAHKTVVKASVRLISGCADNQLSQDGTFNGLFTGVLLRVWNGGAFRGDYHAFHKAILAKMPPDQTPQHSVVGTVDAAYDQLIPFTATPAKFPPRHHQLISQIV